MPPWYTVGRGLCLPGYVGGGGMYASLGMWEEEGYLYIGLPVTLASYYPGIPSFLLLGTPCSP